MQVTGRFAFAMRRAAFALGIEIWSFQLPSRTMESEGICPNRDSKNPIRHENALNKKINSIAQNSYGHTRRGEQFKEGCRARVEADFVDQTVKLLGSDLQERKFF